MTGRARWAIAAGLAAVLAGPGLLAGCGSGTRKDAAPASASASAKPTGLGPARLSGALPRSYDGFGAIAPASAGRYADLPTSAAAGGVADAPAGVTFTPATCKQVIWNGPEKARFGPDQAAVVVLRKPGDTESGTQLWAELIAAPAGSAKAALGTGPRDGCGNVRGSYRGRALSFAEEPAPRLGSGARGALVDGSSGVRRTRVVAFLGNGYVGMVYAQGAVSRTQAGAFARRLYDTAHARLG